MFVHCNGFRLVDSFAYSCFILSCSLDHGNNDIQRLVTYELIIHHFATLSCRLLCTWTIRASFLNAAIISLCWKYPWTTLALLLQDLTKMADLLSLGFRTHTCLFASRRHELCLFHVSYCQTPEDNASLNRKWNLKDPCGERGEVFLFKFGTLKWIPAIPEFKYLLY